MQEHTDLQLINKIKSLLPQEEVLYKLADFFKIFGDSTRLKIIHALFTEEMCVNCLCSILDMSQSAISHQLRVLKQYGIVGYRKDGKYTYYSLQDNHIKEIFDQGLEHMHEKI